MFDSSLIPLVQRLDRDPEDHEAVQLLWRALSERGEFQTLAVLAEKVAARRRDPATAAELLHRAAELWSREIGRDERAVPLWQKALELDPQHDAAASGLAGAFVRAGRSDLAAPLHRRVLERTQDPRRKLPILEQISVMRAEAGDALGQVEVLQEIVSLDLPVAATVEHRRALARLLVQRARAAQSDSDADTHPDVREAARMLGTIAREGGTSRAPDFAAAALALWPGEENAFTILQSTLSLRHLELATLRIKFLAANPGSRMASQVRGDLADGYLAAGRVDDAIAVLAASVAEDPSASSRLARLYERTGRHKDLAALLAETALPSDRKARLVLLRRRATAHRAAGDRKALLASLRDVLADAPADPEALAEVERDCRLQGNHGELRARLHAAAAVEGVDPAQVVKWLREVAQLAERAGDYDDALAALERAAALASDAEVDEVYDAMGRILSHLDRWDELLERVSARARLAPDAAARRRWWLLWVDAQRKHRPDAAREAEVLSALVLDDPSDDGVALALADAYRRAGDVAGVEEVLRGLVARATPENAGARWSQLAGHREQLGDAAGALEAWRQARSIDASQAMAWAAEERLLEQTGQRRELLDVLIAHAGHPTAAGRRAGDLFTRAALLARELELGGEAARLAERALKFVPDDAALQALASGQAAEPEAEKEPTREVLVEAGDDESVPLSLLEDDLAGEGMERDTGEYDVVIPEETSGVFSNEEALHDTGEHTPAEGMRFADGDFESAHAVEGDAPEETVTRERLALTPEVDAVRTREIIVPGLLDVRARPHDDLVLAEEETVTRELQALVEPAAPAAVEEPTRPLQSALREVRAEIARQSAAPPPIVPLPARREEPEELSDESIIVELDEELAPTVPPVVEAPVKPLPALVVAAPSTPPPPPKTPVVTAPPDPPAPPAADLPSIIVDDDLLATPAPAAPPRPPSALPPLAGMPPPRPSSPRVALPSPAAPPVASAPVQHAPLTTPVPPLAAPNAPVLPPSAPALPPLAATGFVTQSPMMPPAPHGAPLASFNAPLAPIAPLNAPLAPLAPLNAQLAPLGPLAPLAPLGPLAPLAPLGQALPGLTFNAAPPPPLNYVDSASGDPFASPPAPAAAFVAEAPTNTYGQVSSGDPFANMPALTPSQAPAPMPPPVAAPVFQKVMAAMFEQAVASIRAHG